MNWNVFWLLAFVVAQNVIFSHQRFCPTMYRAAWFSAAAFVSAVPRQVTGIQKGFDIRFPGLRLRSKNEPVCAAASPPRMSVSTISHAVVQGPAWTLDDEYPSLDSEAVTADIDMAVDCMSKISALSNNISFHLASARSMTLEEARSTGILGDLQMINSLRWKSSVLLRNVYTFANCFASVDGGNDQAKKLVARLSELFAKFSQAVQPASLFLDLCGSDVADAYLSLSDETAENYFLIGHSRKMREHTLSLPEENLLASYEVPGITSWGTLYTDLSATLQVGWEESDGSKRTIGVATAAGFLDSADESMRRNAWLGIKNAWLPHTETCAGILNAITAWRLETYRRRGIRHYMDVPLHKNRMNKETLDAFFEAVHANLDIGRKALRVQAAALGKTVLEPWDLVAPAPLTETSSPELYPFEEGIEVIANAVGAIDKKAGDFVRMMHDNRWIEASKGDAKRPGAYCTGFAKSRNPRVYLSEYNGRAQLLLTLAHELGRTYSCHVFEYCYAFS